MGEGCGTTVINVTSDQTWQGLCTAPQEAARAEEETASLSARVGPCPSFPGTHPSPREGGPVVVGA